MTESLSQLRPSRPALESSFGNEPSDSLAGSVDERCEALLNEFIRPDAGGAGHWARDRSDASTQLACRERGGHCPGALIRLEDHGRTRYARHQPVLRDEPVPGRRRSRWQLTHEQDDILDLAQQIAVPSRVGTVQTAREHRDRRPAGREHGAMRGSFDPVGATLMTTRSSPAIPVVSSPVTCFPYGADARGPSIET